jgi:hypothetical protein
MPNNDSLFFAEGLHQTDHIPDQLEDIIGFNRFRTIGFSVPPLVGGDGVIPRFSQRRELMPPGIAQFRKAVTHNDQRAISLLGNMHFDAVCFNLTVCALHLFSLTIRVKGKSDYRLEIALKPVVPFLYLSLG